MKEILENVKVVGQDHKGRGIVKVNRMPIFVEEALKDEICTVEVIKETSKYKEGKVIEKKISHSIKPKCPYYGICGGCHLQHQRYEEQLKFKESKVKEVLKKFAGIELPLNPIIHDQEWGYRNKVTLHNLGFYQKNSKQVVPIKKCLLVNEKINEIMERLQEHSKNSNQIMEEAVIRVTNKEEVLLNVSGKIHKKTLQKQFSDIDVLIANNTKLKKQDYVTDELLGKRFKISSDSFYQVNRFVTSKLYEQVINVFKNQKRKTVLDLYCGTGTISLLVAPYAERVIGIEVIQDAIKNANDNKVLNKIENVEFICGKVEDYIEKFEEIDATIVDPPRAGLDSKTVTAILKIKPQTVVYVSCDPVTLARDLKALKEEYEIIKITPVDMFPNTYHVECVCVLNRR